MTRHLAPPLGGGARVRYTGTCFEETSSQMAGHRRNGTARSRGEGHRVAKPNYQFEKRKKDLERKKKQDEKRQRKAEKADAKVREGDPPPGDDGGQSPS